ncbi:hypothetical protein LR48_Vigan03g014300 [Vigna angularis]|uniref:non-specific serine/threonine protein kinase n=2 Tax=Phaseolus angularis TaxID=3914 RepID=A0A0L9U261_PHAAN|nr:probable receptor-like protein kinase At5g59700 [Vigna angularis]KAG2403982.1 Receptor-like protein [Vigna angularis]KOM36762.1 hypothetical protein LR48_Vigan03g014300 [Vigna angularis]BAT83237.1 hypothetical protein VIGAN_04035500 [Vigna angularis var. angularis]
MLPKCLGFCGRKQYPTVIQELCHEFSLSDIEKSTNNFDRKRIIAISSFGGKVYEGCLQHHDGSQYSVAITRLNEDDEDIEGRDWFEKEIELLCQFRHPNCVSLIGFCNNKKEKIIVHEYMSNGSLDQHIVRGGDTEALSWRKRIEICIGVARGLHYLHAGLKRTIIHRDVCLRNILLDSHMEPKLASFNH